MGWSDDYLQTASLDHAICFHDHGRVDDWLLYALDSPAAGSSRSLGRGTIYTRDGRLIATVAQAGLIRVLDAPRAGRICSVEGSRTMTGEQPVVPLLPHRTVEHLQVGERPKSRERTVSRQDRLELHRKSRR